MEGDWQLSNLEKVIKMHQSTVSKTVAYTCGRVKAPLDVTVYDVSRWYKFSTFDSTEMS